MGLFDLLERAVDTFSDGARDLLDDDGGGLFDRIGDAFGGDGDGGGLLGQIGNLVGGGGDSSGGGIFGQIGNLVGGGDGGDGGGLFGQIGDLIGGSDIGSTVGQIAESVLGNDGGEAGGGWGGWLGNVIDTVSGGGGNTGIAGGILDLLPDSATTILEDAQAWGGSLLDDIGDVVPGSWVSAANDLLGAGLGEGGFDSLVEQGLDALHDLGIPDSVMTLGGQLLEAGMEGGPNELVEGVLADLGDAVGVDTDDVLGAVGEIADDLDLDGGLIQTAVVEDGVDDFAAQVLDEPMDVAADVVDDVADPAFDDVADGFDDVADAPMPEADFAEPEFDEPVAAPEPEPVVDHFEEAVSSADSFESSVDDMFEGM